MKTVLLQSGFTLIELLMVIAIAAILLTVGAPSFSALIQNNRLATSSNQFVSNLSFARSEAIKRGRTVSLCKSNNQTSCNNGLNWEAGWIVFVDQNSDGTWNGADTVIRVHQGLPKNTLRTGANFANAVCFASRGFPVACGGGGFANDTFRLCDSRADTAKARAIIIAPTGRVTINTATASCP